VELYLHTPNICLHGAVVLSYLSYILSIDGKSIVLTFIMILILCNGGSVCTGTRIGGGRQGQGTDFSSPSRPDRVWAPPSLTSNE
jgi:hypothetical protein